MSSQHETTEARYFGCYFGIVTDSSDPEVLGRVRVRVPGIIDGESAWAWPFGMLGAGAAQRGAFDVPDVSSDVLVMFLGGDPERPLWTGGNFGKPNGKSEVPKPLASVSPGEQSKVKAYETARWLVTYDDRSESPVFRVEDKISGDIVELDGRSMSMNLKGTVQVNITSDGVVAIVAPTITLNGRLVLAGGPIQ